MGEKGEKTICVCVGGVGWACDSEFRERLEEEQWRERPVLCASATVWLIRCSLLWAVNGFA